MTAPSRPAHPRPPTVSLTPTGRESTFEVRVLNPHIPGLRMG